MVSCGPPKRKHFFTQGNSRPEKDCNWGLAFGQWQLISYYRKNLSAWGSQQLSISVLHRSIQQSRGIQTTLEIGEAIEKFEEERQNTIHYSW